LKKLGRSQALKDSTGKNCKKRDGALYLQREKERIGGENGSETHCPQCSPSQYGGLTNPRGS